MYVAKTKLLISCKVAAQLICDFVFVYAKIRFSHDVAHMLWVSMRIAWARNCSHKTVKTRK